MQDEAFNLLRHFGCLNGLLPLDADLAALQ